ncbi:MAG: hypothetical protein CMK09_10535 [Ponticaulis sp.]|nr:hypothetical protein [Ponticaulis sp.]
MPMAHAEMENHSHSHVMCFGSQEEPSAEAMAAAMEFARLVEGHTAGHSNEMDEGDHCPLCTLGHGAPLVETQRSVSAIVFLRHVSFNSYEPAFVHETRGPPVGSRGPPRSI